MTQRFSRRALLQGLSGSLAGLALVPIMARLTRADPMTVSRYVFIVEGNCYEPVTVLADNARAQIDATASQPVGTARWWYNTYQHSAPIIVPSTSFSTAPALGSIATNQLAGQTAVLFGLSSRVTAGGHSAEHGVLSSSRTIGHSPGGITIDAFLGALPQVQQDTPFDVIRLGANGDPLHRIDFGTCAFGRGKPAPLILQPSAAYSVLFGAVGSSMDQAAFRRRGRLLDFGHADVTAALASFSGNSAERAKLEAYLASLETVQRRQDRILGLTQRLTAVRPPTPDVNPLYTNEASHPDVLERFAAQLELATAALLGGLTNVVVVGSGTGGDFDMLYPSTAIPNVTRHNMHHGSADNPAYATNIHDVTRRQMDSIATMAKTLANTPDPSGGGTMLDSTVIVYVSDNGEQHHSTASEFPVVLIGGHALGMHTDGRTVIYPGLDSPGHRQLSNLWNTLGHAAGHDLNTFGTEGPARVAMGPLSEILG